MILFLDTTSDIYVLALATREGVLLHTKKIARDERIGDRAFRVVEHFLKKKKLTAIIAVIGPGRFSGIRHGMSIANTLAFAWTIPLIGVEKKDGETPRALLKRAVLQETSSLLVPHYGQEPTITLKKSF